jgi:hypothetical protein
LLANPFYAGWVPQPSGTGGSNRGAEALLVRGKHEAIISQDTFDTVQEVRAARRGQGRTGSTAGTNHHREGQIAVYVVAGLARCLHCEERLRVQPTGATPSFRDASRERGIACSANRRSIPMPIVDTTVNSYMEAIRLPEDWRRHAVSLLPDSGDEKRRVVAARAAVERKLERATRLVLDGDIDQPTYRAERVRADILGMRRNGRAGDAGRVEQGSVRGAGTQERRDACAEGEQIRRRGDIGVCTLSKHVAAHVRRHGRAGDQDGQGAPTGLEQLCAHYRVTAGAPSLCEVGAESAPPRSSSATTVSTYPEVQSRSLRALAERESYKSYLRMSMAFTFGRTTEITAKIVHVKHVKKQILAKVSGTV